jgi:hypothetical protein
MADLWNFRHDVSMHGDLVGFEVEVEDGRIGRIEAVSKDPDNSVLVIDTGPWIFGRKVPLPAGLVERVDLDSQTVFVGLTKDEIKNAPEVDESPYGMEDSERERIGVYYGSRWSEQAESFGGEPDAW